jgi:hypothetical protein
MLWQQYYIDYVLPSEKVFEVQNPPEDGVITYNVICYGNNIT